MSWDDFRTPGAKEILKDNTSKSNSGNYFYSIYRIGKKYKETTSIRNFEKHMERNMEVPNADKNIDNEILIGDKNINRNVKEYIKGVKLRTNSVIARELLMTASPDFFKGLMVSDLEQWKNDNAKFLKDNFGDNCIYATLHKDEKTWHIHALIVPKFKNKKGEPILSNSRYFDGIEKFRSWQDNYALSMQQHFKCLNRGVKYSAAKHITMKEYYSMLNKKLNENSHEQILAKAKNSELLEIKLKAITRTLETYKKYSNKNELALQDAKVLLKELEKYKGNKSEADKALDSLLSQQYKIPQYAIKEARKQCANINDKENER